MAIPRTKEKSSPIKLMVADSFGIRRQGLVRLLQDRVDMKVVCEIAESRELSEYKDYSSLSVVILARNFSSDNNINPVTLIQRRFPSVNILVLADNPSPMIAIQALRYGALGYVVWKENFDDLCIAIHAVASGSRHLSPIVFDQLLDTIVEGDGFEVGVDSRITEREKEILQLVAEGKSNAEIGSLLTISKRTVESHRARLMQKLGLSSQIEILHYAIKQGLLVID